MNPPPPPSQDGHTTHDPDALSAAVDVNAVSAEQLRAMVAAYAPGTKAKGPTGAALAAAATNLLGRPIDAALAHCHPAPSETGQGLVVISQAGLTVAHAPKKGDVAVWALPWNVIAPFIADGPRFTFASEIRTLGGEYRSWQKAPGKHSCTPAAQQPPGHDGVEAARRASAASPAKPGPSMVSP